MPASAGFFIGDDSVQNNAYSKILVVSSVQVIIWIVPSVMVILSISVRLPVWLSVVALVMVYGLM